MYQYQSETPSVDRADYRQIQEQFPWLNEPDHPMVCSLDLDGLVSAMLMESLLGWRLVGFYDAQRLWVRSDVDIFSGEVVFLDHDIYRESIPSVGHHMLQWQKDIPLPGHQRSLNPNLLRGITAEEFGRKYPFGTLHLLLACHSAWHPEWRETKLRLPREFLPVLLNVDSAMQSAFTYLRNAKEWLEWLGGSEEDSPLFPFCRLLLSASPRRLLDWGIEFDEEMARLGLGARSPYTKRRAQAQRLDPTLREDWKKLDNLVKWLREISPWELTLPEFPDLAERGDLRVVEMRRMSVKSTKGQFRAMLDQKPFSYAIISAGENGLNYSLFPEL